MCWLNEVCRGGEWVVVVVVVVVAVVVVEGVVGMCWLGGRDEMVDDVVCAKSLCVADGPARRGCFGFVSRTGRGKYGIR